MQRSTDPDVSVVIPAYNCGGTIRDAVAAARVQTHRPREIIVVDDASADDTLEKLDAISGPDLIVLRSARNAGGGAARNRGVQAARGDLIAFLDAGAAIGFFAVLHTWGQTLMHHPHLHCVVPGGGLSPDGTRWSACRPGFFLPVRVLSRLFRRLFLAALQQAFGTGQRHFPGSLHALADPSGFAAHLQPTRQHDWVVYAKPPFAGPQQVLQEYVGRYTHRVAIANQRLLDMDDGHVRFRYKNYRAASPQTPHAMTLDALEFIRRLLLHLLPAGRDLYGAEIELVAAEQREFVLRQALDEVRADYEILLIDCPPSSAC